MIVGALTNQPLIGLDLPVIMGTVIYGAFFIVPATRGWGRIGDPHG